MRWNLLSHVRLLVTPIDCSPPGFSVHEVSQARILEWVAISFSRGSSRPRDWTLVSCIAGGLLHTHISNMHSLPVFFSLIPPLGCGQPVGKDYARLILVSSTVHSSYSINICLNYYVCTNHWILSKCPRFLVHDRLFNIFFLKKLH